MLTKMCSVLLVSWPPPAEARSQADQTFGTFGLSNLKPAGSPDHQDVPDEGNFAKVVGGQVKQNRRSSLAECAVLKDIAFSLRLRWTSISCMCP